MPLNLCGNCKWWDTDKIESPRKPGSQGFCRYKVDYKVVLPEKLPASFLHPGPMKVMMGAKSGRGCQTWEGKS